MKKIDFWAIGLLVLAFLGLCFLPFIVTQTSTLNFFNVDFGDSNEIGDMIGGITGPFVALISASLVYLTLREQIDMNDKFKTRFEKEDDNKFKETNYRESIDLLNKLSSFFTNFEIYHHNGKLKGQYAIIDIMDDLFRKGDFSNPLNYINYSKLLLNLHLLRTSSNNLISQGHETEHLKNYLFNLQHIINSNFPPHLIDDLEKISFANGKKIIRINKNGRELFETWRGVCDNSKMLWETLIKNGESSLENNRIIYTTQDHYFNRIKILK